MFRITSVTDLISRLAVLIGVVLLLSNLRAMEGAAHAWLSSLPLALAGAGFAILQIRLRPEPSTLFRRLLLAAAFLMWGVDQLLPAGRLATFIGDAVIFAYVLDLYWMMEGEQSNSPPEAID